MTDVATLDTLAPLVVTLPSGLRVVATRLPSAHRVALVAHLRVGSRYETEAANGISHLLEHMLYRGIPGFPSAHEQALAFERLGGTLVAATGSDSGSVAISCPKESFEGSLRLFSSVYREPLLTGLDVEKKIIREELLEDLNEEGALIDDYDLLREVAFDGHPLGFPVIGTLEHLDRLAVPDLRRHHDKHYVGVNTVVSVAGPIDPEAVVRDVERQFAALASGAQPPLLPPRAPTGPNVHFVKSSSSQTSLRLGFRGVGLRDRLEPGSEAVLRLLDDGNSTRLYTRLCDELGLAYDVSAGYEASDDAGLLDIACDAAHREARRVLSEILDVVRQVRDDGPTQGELDKAKARHHWGLEELLDSPSALAEFFADGTLREHARTPAERRDQIESVTLQAVSEAASALFRPENLSVVVVGIQAKSARSALRELIARFR